MSKQQRQTGLSEAFGLEPRKRARRDDSLGLEWKVSSSLLIGQWREQEMSKKKVATFDFDGTIASVRGSHIHPKNGDDWVWSHSSVPRVLAHLHSHGWRIVILSNQRGILDPKNPKSKHRREAFQGRVVNVIKSLEDETGLEIPIQIYASASDDAFRKPRRGMWDLLLKKLESKDMDWSKSFYVGDAAGRPQSWIRGHKKDFADTDLKFAANAGIPFFVPEQVFHSLALKPDESNKEHPLLPITIADLPTIPTPEFHPPSLSLAPVADRNQKTPRAHSKQELILLVGAPGSGKTLHVQTHFSDPLKFLHVNQDSLKTKAKCLAETARGLEEGLSVVIDNTNPDKKTRLEYMTLARKKSVPVRCLHFTIPEKICKHNNAYREFHQKAKSRVPSVAYATFYSRLDSPSLEEGFNEIQKIEWEPHFPLGSDKEAWEMFYF